MSDWQLIETAPLDADILVLREGRMYVARWRDQWRTWGVNAERIPGTQEPFTDIGQIGFESYIAARGPTHWMPLPGDPAGYNPKDGPA